MREILFRGKDYKTGIWLEGSLINLDVQSGYVYISEPYESGSSLPPLDLVKMFSHLVKPETVGQYTGLKDKNGKKIFEGDIVKRTFVGYESFESYTKLVVADLKTTFPEIYNDKDWTFDCEYEVIGNLYDNPELTHQHEDKGE